MQSQSLLSPSESCQQCVLWTYKLMEHGSSSEDECELSPSEPWLVACLNSKEETSPQQLQHHLRNTLLTSSRNWYSWLSSHVRWLWGNLKWRLGRRKQNSDAQSRSKGSGSYRENQTSCQSDYVAVIILADNAVSQYSCFLIMSWLWCSRRPVAECGRPSFPPERQCKGPGTLIFLRKVSASRRNLVCSSTQIRSAMGGVQNEAWRTPTDASSWRNVSSLAESLISGWNQPRLLCYTYTCQEDVTVFGTEF